MPLPPKAIDTLAALLAKPGHVLLKDDLMRQVWPDTYVEEGNLTQQISLLRKAFSDVGPEVVGIETLPRRGYRLVGTVTAAATDEVLVARERSRTTVVVEETGPPSFAGPARSAAERARLSKGWLATVTLTAVVGVALVAGAFAWLAASRPALPFERRDWVLLLDFENTTGDPRFNRALASAFSVGLEQSRHFNVYSRTRTIAALRRMGKSADGPLSEEVGVELARRDGVRAIVAASIARAGSQFVLTARLVDPQRLLTVAAYSARAANEDQLLDALDVLSRNVRQGLGESRASISRSSRPLPQVTTGSFAALQAYVEGGRAWSRGRLKEGISSLERAIALDPGFAVVHAELGSAYSSHVVRDPAKAARHFETALALAHRVTDRERMLIEARHHAALERWPDVVHGYDQYLKVYPDDPVAQLNRGLALMRMKRHAEAIAGFEQVLRINPSTSAALLNIATASMALGHYRQAVGAYEQAFKLEPSWLQVANINHEFGFALVGAGELAKAREGFHQALTHPETAATAWRSLALVDLYEGRYRDAEAKLSESGRLSAGPEGVLRRARNHLFMALVRDGQGRSRDVVSELDRAVAALAEIPPDPLFTLRTAAAYARAGAVDKAEELVRSVHALVDPKSADAHGELQRALGEIALAKGAYDEAISAFRAADLASSTPMTLEGLAHAHQVAGRADEAFRAYERLGASHDWLGWEPQQAWSVAQVRLAELSARRGDRVRALTLLDAFLARWQHADADLPLIVEARRLSGSLRR
ncbi:MAG: tetratricopeptide repeat protein [Acidobacteriota bacterium]